MEVLKQDIEKLNYMIEHAKSKSQKRQFIFTLEGLYEVLNELENKLHIVNKSDEDINFLMKFDIANKIKKFTRYCQDDYRDFVSCFSKNSL